MKNLKQDKIYAIYEGDNWITDGTLREIANFMGLTLGTIRTYKAKRKKYIFVEVGVKYESELFNGKI